ncbi:MAG: DUF1566 domain-containing protein, partial [Aestuariibacter sp.]|nr:DUF1566 domain-containing protein [Aestuariibacter sp.]
NCGDTSDESSHQTDWRLPNVKEYQSLIDFGQSNPALPSGYGTFFTDVQTTNNYWSSTSNVSYPANAWRVFMDDGGVYSTSKAVSFRGWAVRGGQ